MKEIWKGIIYNYEDISERYEISNLGNIRNTKTKYILNLFINKNGYKQVCVSLGGRKKRKVLKIHKAVAETFSNRPLSKKYIVNHLDGNKLNNNTNNLEWCTYSENNKHAYKLGLTPFPEGTKAPKAKLTNKDVQYIRMVYIPYDKEFGLTALAKQFGITKRNMQYVVNRQTYKNIPS